MDTNTYRASLEAEKSRLEAELATVGRPSERNPQDWDAVPEGHDDDRADENTNADLLEDLVNDDAIVRQLESQLAEVAAAIARIDAGSFGRCETCDAEIEADRLAANPAARTCKAHLHLNG